ncbi:translocation and assembly module lipoprotein TamL [Pedobacter nutrimenti]|nr:BamA/TamA family outer membrane protein [Pedobacter nutrimenti]
MKAYPNYKTKIQFPAILLFIILFVTACSSTKYIQDYQAIVKKVEIDSIPKKMQEEAYTYVQKDIRPAPKLGVNVGLYNLFYGLFKTKSVGNPAPLLDSTLVEISRSQIEKFLKSKGYFNAKVNSSITVKKQRAQVYFKADTGKGFFISKINYDFEDPKIKDLYFSRKQGLTHLKDGMRYDEDSLSYERDKIYEIAKQNGYFDFLKPYIRYSVDSNSNDGKAKVTMIVDNPEGQKEHRQYTIGETNIFIAPDADGFTTDSLVRNPHIANGIRFTSYSKRFRRNPIVRYDFIKEGELYDNTKDQLTYDRLYQLNAFKNVKIDYLKAKDSSAKVEPIIRLIPQKKMSNRIEGELPFNAGTIGFTLGNTYTNNNMFRGAERFEVQVKGGVQSRVDGGGSIFKDIYQQDFSISTSLAVPRLMVPFKIPLMGKNGMPYTSFAISYIYSLQKDVLSRRIFQTSMTYDWYETKYKIHSFTPLNIEYRLGNVLITDPEVYRANFYNIILLNQKNITLGMKYSYILNQGKLLLPASFIYFRGGLETAGNLLQAISKLTGNDHRVPSATDPSLLEPAKILGLPYTQFVRPEIDVRWYKNLGGARQFVARLNAGAAIAYGNSSGAGIPIDKSFFAGGSNGIRAWQARTIGPGNYDRGKVLTTEDLRRAVFGLDQLGELHIETNFEYRYKLLNKFFGAQLKGAVFVDAGNVWNVSKSAIRDNPDSEFKFQKLFDQIAIGTGVGLRYDVDYFVFRFDVGLKIKDPMFSGSDQWVISKFFSGGKEFKANYYTTHSPDNYRFVQYNFGIGLPF